MRFSVKAQSPDTHKTDGLVVGVFEDKPNSPTVSAINKALGGRLKKLMAAEDFTGKSGQKFTINSLGKHPAGKIILAGLGKEKSLTEDKIRKVSAICAVAMRTAGIKSYSATLASAPVNGLSLSTLAQATAEGAMLALYTFEELKNKKEKKRVEALTLLAAKKSDVKKITAGAKKGKALAEAASVARDLINLPGNFATPTHLANTAKKMSARFGIKCNVLGPAQIKRLGMGGLMGVAKGSAEPARFIVMEWMKGPKGKKPIVAVGKGLTFDTGGISIKPAGDMHEMKSDMSGGAAVIGVMQAAAALKLKVNLVGLVPTTENMPGGASYKPGDVLKGLSGVTMEIMNTDAEGRLILSDALAYAGRYKPDCTVDIATLTGACMIALGKHASGVFSNDDKLRSQIRESGEVTGERCWPMPVWPDHDKEIKSDVADIKNIGPRGGGASTAAAFLKKHVKGKWAHIDIAGTAFNSGAKVHYHTKGGLGIGVRLLIDFIEKRAKLK